MEPHRQEPVIETENDFGSYAFGLPVYVDMRARLNDDDDDDDDDE